MSYDYATERAAIFTEHGQEMFIEIRDAAHRLVKISGAVVMAKLLVGSGDCWTMMACVHRLVELGELRTIWNEGAGQDEVFVRGPKFHGGQ